MSCIQEMTQPLGNDLKKSKKRYPNKKLLIKRDNKILDSMEWWNNLTCEERERKILLLFTRRHKNGI